MSPPPLPSNHSDAQRHIRHRLAHETDPLLIRLLTTELHRLTALENRERVHIALERDRSFALTQSASASRHEVPIPCGLRGARDNPGFKQEEHWFYSRLSEREAKLMQKMTDQWVKNFDVPLPRALAIKLAGAGRTLMQALQFFNCAVFLQIPEEARRANGKQILAVVESKTKEGF